MSEVWMNYTALGQLWGMSPEAARTRARRGRFQRRVGNDGQAEVLVDTAAPIRKPRPPRAGGQTQTVPPLTTPDKESPPAATVTLLEALQAHVDTLKGELAKADARADLHRQERDIERERVADLTSQLLRITADLAEARKVEAARPRGWWARLVG